MRLHELPCDALLSQLKSLALSRVSADVACGGVTPSELELKFLSDHAAENEAQRLFCERYENGYPYVLLVHVVLLPHQDARRKEACGAPVHAWSPS